MSALFNEMRSAEYTSERERGTSKAFVLLSLYLMYNELQCRDRRCSKRLLFALPVRNLEPAALYEFPGAFCTSVQGLGQIEG